MKRCTILYIALVISAASAQTTTTFTFENLQPQKTNNANPLENYSVDELQKVSSTTEQTPIATEEIKIPQLETELLKDENITPEINLNTKSTEQTSNNTDSTSNEIKNQIKTEKEESVKVDPELKTVPASPIVAPEMPTTFTEVTEITKISVLDDNKENKDKASEKEKKETSMNSEEIPQVKASKVTTTKTNEPPLLINQNKQTQKPLSEAITQERPKDIPDYWNHITGTIKAKDFENLPQGSKIQLAIEAIDKVTGKRTAHLVIGFKASQVPSKYFLNYSAARLNKANFDYVIRAKVFDIKGNMLYMNNRNQSLPENNSVKLDLIV